MPKSFNVVRFTDGKRAHVGTCATDAATRGTYPATPATTSEGEPAPPGFTCRTCGGTGRRIRTEERPERGDVLGAGKETLRRVTLRPYRKGYGPTFFLRTYDTGKTDDRGVTVQGYVFRMREPGKRAVTLFAGEDFRGSPCSADDSDDCVRALLGFLTLRPGDTDAEYFAGYTPAQRAYAEEHAETLSAEVYARFGEG